MSKFYCRERELAVLEKRYSGVDFECMVIYGRRRVGKTALIREFCKGKRTIFFSAVNSTEQENLGYLSRAIFSLEHGESCNAEFPTYDAAFADVARLAQNERIVMVIDEYPYLARTKEGVSSVLQHVIDHKWSETKLFLILCGSSMSFMENQVLGRESPLYGRRTGQLKILPMDYRQTAVFNPGVSHADNALIYGVTGGVPHYINKLNVRKSAGRAIIESVFDPSSYLYEEPGNLLKQELREPAIYNAIITGIAGGASRLNDIATKIGETSATCTNYIKTLIELGIVKRETPVAEKPGGKKTVYRLSDNFFRFWYYFVPRNRSLIERGTIAEAYSTAVKPYLSDYMGLVFEKMCREWLLNYATDLPIKINEIGEWWGTDSVKRKEVQIDIVASPVAGDEYIIGSCKYRNEKIGIDELELLKEYAKVFGKGSKYHYFIFSKSGWTQSLASLSDRHEVTLVDLPMLYSDRKSDIADTRSM